MIKRNLESNSSSSWMTFVWNLFSQNQRQLRERRLNRAKDRSQGYIRVDGLMRPRVKGDILFLTFAGEDGANGADEEDEAVGRDTVVEHEELLGGGDGGEDGDCESVLDVGRCAILLRQFGRDRTDLVLCWDGQ